MRIVKLQMQFSMDGYVAGPNNEMDWMQMNWDDELKKYVGDLTRPVDCILLGRKLAEGFVPAWTSQDQNPETANEFTHKMVYARKLVFSRSLQELPWPHTELVKEGDLKEVVTKLKEEKGGDIIAYGGVGFVSGLIQDGLVDEYYMFINPASVGDGKTPFKGINKNNFRLTEAKKFDCGVALLKYEAAR